MPRKTAENRNRLPFEDISNKLNDQDESTFLEELDEDNYELTPRRRGKLSECSEYEPIPDDGDTCSSLIFSSMDFDETSNSCDYGFSELVNAPFKISENDLPSSSSESAAIFSAGSKKKKPEKKPVLPSPEGIELARFTSTPLAVEPDSSFFTPDHKMAGIPFPGFSSCSPETETIFSPKNRKKPEATLNSGVSAALVEPDFQRKLRKRPIPAWRKERSEGEPLSKKRKLPSEHKFAIELQEPAKIVASPSLEFISMPKKENLQKRAETLFSPTKRALPSFNLFGATTRTPNRQVLTEVPRDSDFSPFTSSAPQDLLPKDFLKLLGGDFSGQLFKKMLIFDCRYEYEFEGGHFRNAINTSYDRKDWQEILKKHTFENELVAAEGQDTAIVFHCEFSQKRGPYEKDWFRRHDRAVNRTRYPHLTFPHVRLLKGGFKNFWSECNFNDVPAGTYATNLESGIPNYVKEHDKNHLKRQEASRKAEKKNKRENKVRNQLIFHKGPSSTQSPPIRFRGMSTPDSCTRSKDRHLRSSQLANLTPDQSRNRGEKKNRRMSKNKSCKQLFK